MATISSLVVRLATNTAQFTSGIAKSTKSLENFAKEVRKIQKRIGKGLIAGGSLIAADSIRNITEFTDQLADLRAITGATGDDLDFLRNKALELAADSTKSSDQIVTAFKLVGSAKPELLGNVQALAAVTDQVITLAEAARLDLPEAVSATVVGLNQFGEGASEAARFVNVLAAGSKAGASEIAATAAAIRDSGTIAAQAGISYETLNGAIQTLAEAQITGGKAGNALKNIFVNLESQVNDNYRPSIVGLVGALENLNAANLSTVERTKLFGKEALSAGNVLIDSASKVQSYTDAVTGTNVAQEQARTQIDSLAGDLKRLAAQYDAVSTQIGSNFVPGTRGVVQGLTDILAAIDLVIDPLDEANAKFGILDFTLKSLAKAFLLATKFVKDFKAVLDFNVDAVQNGLERIFATLDFTLSSEQRANIRDSISDDFRQSRLNLGDELAQMENDIRRAFDVLDFGTDSVAQLEDYTKRLRELGQVSSQIASNAAEGPAIDTGPSLEELRKLEEQARKTFETIRRSSLSQSELIQENLARDILAIQEAVAAVPALALEGEKVIAALTAQATETLERLAKSTQDETDKLSVFAEQAARNMQDHFADFLFDPFEDGLKGMLKGFVDTLRRMVAQAAAANIFQSLGLGAGSGGGSLSGLLGSLFTAGGSAGSTGGGSGIFAGVTGAVTGATGFGAKSAPAITVNNYNDNRNVASGDLAQIEAAMEQNRIATERSIADQLRRGLIPVS